MLVSVWEENRGCERHDILSWPQILQNLTLRKTLPADPLLSMRNLFQGCLRGATHLLCGLPRPAAKLHTHFLVLVVVILLD